MQIPFTDPFPDFLQQEFPDFETDKPLVLLLGSVSHEGITSSIRAGGEQYKQKLLASTVENWISIVRIFRLFRVRAVVVKLNAWTYSKFADPSYAVVRDKLLLSISKVPHIFFAHEDILSGVTTEDSAFSQEEFIRRRVGDIGDEEMESYRSYFGFKLPDESVLKDASAAFQRFNITLIPYRANADVTVMSVQFLKDALQNLLFRIYVPIGRLWADEVDRLLSLFREYLLSTGRTGVRLDQSKTDHGVSYEFHATEDMSSISLESEFREFTRVLDLSLSDPSAAEDVLRNKSVDAKEIEDIITRYAKQARRLHVDIKHDRERKILAIRQRLESELSEVLPSSAWNLIQLLVERAIPSASNLPSVLAVDSAPLPHASQYGSLTLNLNPQIIHDVSGIVTREIRGHIVLAPTGRNSLS